MAEEIDDDPWLDQLREALADVSDARDERPAPGESTMPEGEVDWSSIEPADEPAPLPPPPELVDDPDPVEPPVAPTAADTALVVEALTKMGNEIAALTRRVDDFETQTAAPAEQVTVAFDQVELDVVVADAIRQSMARAQATGAGTTRLETEVRVLEETVSKLTKRVGDLNVTALARDRLEKDVHVERLAEAAEAVQSQLAVASEARQSFDASVEKMLRHAQEGGGTDVAWTDVMLLAHELRSRVDDLDDQQRRAMRDLADWQASVDDRISTMRADLVREIRNLRDPADEV